MDGIKYVVFWMTVVGIVPATVWLLTHRQHIRWAVLGLFLPVLNFNKTAINFFSRETYRGTSRGMEISLIYIVAVVIISFVTLLRKGRRVLPEAGTWIYLAYWLLCLPSLAEALEPTYGLAELWKMVMMHLVFLAVYYYLEYSKGDFEILLYGIACIVIVNFITIVVQQYLIGVYQAKGCFPHQNSMAMYMAIAAPLFFAYAYNNGGVLTGKFFFLCFAMAALSLARSFSRGAIFCFPIAIGITLVCSLLRLSYRKIVLLLPMLAVAGILVYLLLPKIMERYANAPEQSGETRKELAYIALTMMKDHPWTGIGINNWGMATRPFQKYGDMRENDKREDEESSYTIVETIYLLVAGECGLPCLLALLVWFGYYWVSCIQLVVHLRKTPYLYLPAGLLGSLTAVFLQSALEWVLKQQINFTLLVISFAIISYLNIHWKGLVAMAEAAAAAKVKAKADGARAMSPPEAAIPGMQDTL